MFITVINVDKQHKTVRFVMIQVENLVFFVTQQGLVRHFSMQLD